MVLRDWLCWSCGASASKEVDRLQEACAPRTSGADLLSSRDSASPFQAITGCDNESLDDVQLPNAEFEPGTARSLCGGASLSEVAGRLRRSLSAEASNLRTGRSRPASAEAKWTLQLEGESLVASPLGQLEEQLRNSNHPSRTSCRWTGSPSPYSHSNVPTASLATGISPIFGALRPSATASQAPSSGSPFREMAPGMATAPRKDSRAARMRSTTSAPGAQLHASLSEPWTHSGSPGSCDAAAAAAAHTGRRPAPPANGIMAATTAQQGMANGAVAGTAAAAGRSARAGKATSGLAVHGAPSAPAAAVVAVEAGAGAAATKRSSAQTAYGGGSEAEGPLHSVEEGEGPTLVPLYGGFSLMTGSDRAIGRRLLRMVQMDSGALQAPSAGTRGLLGTVGETLRLVSDADADVASPRHGTGVQSLSPVPCRAGGASAGPPAVAPSPVTPAPVAVAAAPPPSRVPYTVGPSPLSGSRPKQQLRQGSMTQAPQQQQLQQRQEGQQPPAPRPLPPPPLSSDLCDPQPRRAQQQQQPQNQQQQQQPHVALQLQPCYNQRAANPNPNPSYNLNHYYNPHGGGLAFARRTSGALEGRARRPTGEDAAGPEAHGVMYAGGKHGAGREAERGFAGELLPARSSGRVGRPGAARDASQVAMLQMLHFGSASGHVPLHHLASLNLGAMQREIAALHWVGQGGGGAVFQGVWQGAPVAVKFMLASSPAHLDATALEAIVSLAMGHPNVVTTYAFDVARVTDASLMESATDMFASQQATGNVDDASATALYNALMGSYAALPDINGTGTGNGTLPALSQSQQRIRSLAMSLRQQQLQLLQPSTTSGSFTAGTGGGANLAAAGAAGEGVGSVGGGAPRGSFVRAESLGVRMQRAQAAAAAAAGGGGSALCTANADLDGGANGGAASAGHSPELERAASGIAASGSGGLVSTFFSEEGFGEPDLTASSRAWSVRQVLAYLKARPGMYLTHVIMEYCDRGSLLAAIKRGIFRMDGSAEEAGQGSGSSGEGGGGESGGGCDAARRFGRRIVLRALLRTARDVAQGMCHLHANGIIHGDLKPGNVLLRGCRSDRRGFTALVSDFGLSKVTRGDKPLELNHWSTVTVMAPEVILGRWSKASDVFSFGVLLWQLVTGDTMPYGKRTVQQILVGVSQGTLKPEWPASAHPALVRLGKACLATCPEDRPSFGAIVKILTKIEEKVRDEIRPYRTSAGGAPSPAAAAGAAAAAAGRGDPQTRW